MKTVKDYLSKVKANRYTYYNLDKKTVSEFKKLYNYLKRNKDKKIYLSCQNSVHYWLNKENEIDFLKKFIAMQCISTGIY